VLLVLSELAILYMPGGGDARPAADSIVPSGAGSDRSRLSQRLAVSLRSVELHLAHPAAQVGVGSGAAAAAAAAAVHENFARVEGIRGSLLVRNATPAQAAQPHTSAGSEQTAGVGNSIQGSGSGGGGAATALVLVGRVEARANLRSQQVCQK
jgi:hypothetical protein